MDSTETGSEMVSSSIAAGMGLGMIVLALFPLAIPFVALTLVAILPLALPLVVLALVGAIITGAWLGLRGAARGVRRIGRGPERASAGAAAESETLT